MLRAWAGLGYYARARNLHRAAADRRARPRRRAARATPDALASLPGVGPLHRRRARSIAFDEPAPLVDGNVERVLARAARRRDELAATPSCGGSPRRCVARASEPGRLEPGADGARRHGLHAAQAALRACPGRVVLRRARAGRRRALPARRAKRAAVRAVRALAGAGRARAAACCSCGGRRAGCSAGCGSCRTWRAATRPRAASRRCASAPACAPRSGPSLGRLRHQFTHRDLALEVVRLDDAGGRLAARRPRRGALLLGAPTSSGCRSRALTKKALALRRPM